MPCAAATASPHATAAALQILASGGNALDAAAAAAWALSVCEPAGSGLGGHTLLLLRTAAGEIKVVSGRQHAPQAASLRTISALQQRLGRRATTVPSTVATLDFVQRRYGRLARGPVLAPAVCLAQAGFPISGLQHQESRWTAGTLASAPETAALFLNRGAPLREGEILRQPLLAATLLRLAESGAEDFYYGDIAASIVADMTAHGGVLRSRDLALADTPLLPPPLEGSYRGYRVVTAPPPAGGSQLLRALDFLERRGPFRARDADWYEAIAAAIQQAFSCPDPGSHSAVLAQPSDTTHLSVADGEGNVVALTQSIQSLYGAKTAHPTLGFLYNNFLQNCTRRPGPAQLRGGCIPSSNAAPTLVFRPGHLGGGLLMALGAAGSRRIASSILQTISAVIDLGETIHHALAAPRIHGLPGGAVRLERALAPPVLDALRRRFSHLILRPARDFSMGAVQALHFDAAGAITAAADPRRDGVGAVAPDWP